MNGYSGFQSSEELKALCERGLAGNDQTVSGRPMTQNVFSSFHELVYGLNPSVPEEEPLEWFIMFNGKLLCNFHTCEELLAFCDRGIAGEDLAVSDHPMTQNESILAVKNQRQLWTTVKEEIPPRSYIAASRRLRVRAPRPGRIRRSGRIHRGSRTHKAAVSRTGPPGSSEDGDPEPGEAGPHSHRLETIETAKTRQRGSHV